VKLSEVPAGSVVLVRAHVRRYRGCEDRFTDLLIVHEDGSRDSGAGTARLFHHDAVEVEMVEQPV
jgi:hypothetical protein